MTLQEGKAEPDYSYSNMHQVSLFLDGKMEDATFSAFIQQEQLTRPPEKKLGVQEVIGLYKLKQGLYASVNPNVIKRLEEEHLIFRTTNSSRYELPVNYYKLTTEEKRIGIRYHVNEVEQLLNTLHNRKLKMGELEVELAAYLNRNQIKYLITKLIEDGIITSDGAGRGTKYILVELLNMADNLTLIKNILDSLHKKYSSFSEELSPPVSMN